MKNLLKNTIIITGAICIGLLLAYPIMHYSGNKNVRTLANSAIQEAVNADFYKREIAKRTGNSDNLPGKIKKVSLIDEKGEKEIELQDSTEFYEAHKKIVQDILATINPLKPDELSLLFQKELSQRNMDATVGIVYRTPSGSRYSNQDSVSFHHALQTETIYLNQDSSLQVQGWMMCSRSMLLSHADGTSRGIACLLFILIVFAGIFYCMHKKKDIQEKDTPTYFRIDRNLQKIYIEGKACELTQTEFLLMELFIEQEGNIVTQEQIVQKLWPQEKDKATQSALANRLRTHVSHLRESLQDFPQCKINPQKGVGYRLVRI